MKSCIFWVHAHIWSGWTICELTHNAEWRAEWRPVLKTVQAQETKTNEQGPSAGPSSLQHQGILRYNMGIISLFSVTQAVGKESPSDVWLSWACFWQWPCIPHWREKRWKKKGGIGRKESYCGRPQSSVCQGGTFNKAAEMTQVSSPWLRGEYRNTLKMFWAV